MNARAVVMALVEPRCDLAARQITRAVDDIAADPRIGLIDGQQAQIAIAPAYTDAELVQGYAGLETVTVELASYEPAGDGGIDLYLGLVAHESKPHGQQTALHCVVWRFSPDTGTILGISGRAEVEVLPGFVDPSTVARFPSSALCETPASAGPVADLTPAIPIRCVRARSPFPES